MIEQAWTNLQAMRTYIFGENGIPTDTISIGKIVTYSTVLRPNLKLEVSMKESQFKIVYTHGQN
jgi:hypothetical protein